MGFQDRQFLHECEQEPERERHHPSDDFEFVRGAMIAAIFGVTIWAIIFFIVTLAFS